eukprot:2950614-Rhodomonas_salina.1
MSEEETPEKTRKHALSSMAGILHNWHEGTDPRYYEFKFYWFKTDAEFDKELITNAFGEGTKYRRSATPKPMPCNGSSYKLETRVQEHVYTINIFRLFRSNHRFEPPLSLQSSDEYTGAPRPTQP